MKSYMKKIYRFIISVVHYCINKIIYGKQIEMAILNSIKGTCKIELESESKCQIGKFLMTSGPFYLKCTQGANVLIGDRNFFNHNCSITCVERIEIGNGCNFANNLVIVDHDHNLGGKGVKEGFNASPVVIGNNVWCGANVTILKGVKIGDGAVIAAGAIVNTEIPAYEIWGGIPARCIKKMGDGNVN